MQPLKSDLSIHLDVNASEVNTFKERFYTTRDIVFQAGSGLDHQISMKLRNENAF